MIFKDATAVINVHREGALLAPTLHSLVLAKQVAREQGFKVVFDVVADRADQRTMDVVASFGDEIDRVQHVEYGNLTSSRDHGIREAQTDFVFLHDGDDLYSSNWYAALWQRMQAGQVDAETVYHTRLFARFGDLYDIYKTPDSASLSFDPWTLLVDWYFSNKCAFHRGLVERYEIPPIIKEFGIGNEDWSWSTDTIAEGVRHTYLPDTICFYRVKPHHLSLGALKGIMQSPSPLYTAAYAEARAAAREGLPTSRLAPNEGFDMPVLEAWPDEFLGEVFDTERAIQGRFEPLLTMFPRLGYTATTAVKEKPQFPRLGRFYRKAKQMLGDGPLNLVWMPAHLPFPKDQLLDLLDEALALADTALGEAEPARMLVFFEDFPDGEILQDLGRWNALGFNLAAFDKSGLCPDFQRNRFLMRFLMQNPIRASVDLGTPTLAHLVRDFPAAYCHFAPDHVAVLPQRRVDWYDEAMAMTMTTAHAISTQTRRTCPVIAFSEGVAQALAAPGVALLAEGEALAEAAAEMAARRMALALDLEAPARTGPGAVPLAALLRRAATARATPLPERNPEAAPGGLRERDGVFDLTSEGAVINDHFRNAGPWVLDNFDSGDIVMPCNIFFRLGDRDHAMWLPHKDPRDSIRRFLDMIAKNPEARVPFSLAIRANRPDVAKDLAAAATPLELYTKLAVDYADRLLIAQESVVMPGYAS